MLAPFMLAAFLTGASPPPAIVAPSTLVAVPSSPACSIGTAVYSQGTMSCMSGRQYECVDGAWRAAVGPGSTC